MRLRMLAVLVTLSLFTLVSSLSAQSVDVDAIRKAADQGDAHAQNHLGNLYQGGQGVAQDYAQAAIWYRKAAEQGDSYAQSHLGYLYFAGKGVAQDYAQAAIWTRKAAEQGSAVAQDNLGHLYESGQGLPQDYAQ